jgi:hypothetical protein
MKLDIKQQIKDHWFKDHVATLTQHGSLQVLDWKRPTSNTYRCRYVFDGCFMYISGDIGEAVFRLTWNAGVHTFKGTYLGYFYRKLSAYSDEKMDFDSDNAVKGLREWIRRLKDNGEKYDHYEMRDLFEQARGCDNKRGWAEIVNDHYDFISGLDQDFWEWIYNIGDEIPARIHAYLIGLQMASQQLAKIEELKGGKAHE